MSHTVLIADDSPLIRRALRACIERNTDWQVCGEAGDGEIAVEQVKRLHPDVVILDWLMPIMNGLEAAKRIARIAPNTTVLMFTMYECERLRHDAQAIGVKDVFSKTDHAADRLIGALSKLDAAA